MLKMYHVNQPSAGTSEYWEQSWKEINLAEVVKFCETDPLKPLFEEYARPNSLMLEGGCGIGQNVIYYTNRGVKVIGLDFARETLSMLHKVDERLLLSVGDVSNMPFKDETFDVYYSGGVVEHFEAGCEASLKDARRVIKRDGVLLISVPYFSLLRRVIYFFNKDKWKIVNQSEISSQKDDELNFYQYAYRKSEFKKMLKQAGLKVVKTQGISILWGIYEISFMKLIRRPAKSTQSHNNVADSSNFNEDSFDLLTVSDQVQKPQSLLKRLLVSEDASVPVLGLGVRLLRELCSNMMMYVCVRDE